jgi:hypothetical protein
VIASTILAGVELFARSAARRAGAERRHGRITRLSFRLVSVLYLGLLVTIVATAGENTKPAVTSMKVGSLGFVEEVNFRLTAIVPNAACHDPYRQRRPGEQFLRFDLEVWSTVDQFVDPATASGLSLRHWSVDSSHAFFETDPLYMYSKCGDGTEAISQPIIPGTHTETVVVINAPKSAAFLQLDIPTFNGVLRWPIPPVGW